MSVPRIGVHPRLGIFVRSDGAVRIHCNGYPQRDEWVWSFGTVKPKKCHGKVLEYKSVMFEYKHYAVHRLVAETFLPNPEGKPTVDHIDRNPGNNDVSNLRWATYEEQVENSGVVLNRIPTKHRSKDGLSQYRKDRFCIDPGFKERYFKSCADFREANREILCMDSMVRFYINEAKKLFEEQLRRRRLSNPNFAPKTIPEWTMDSLKRRDWSLRRSHQVWTMLQMLEQMTWRKSGTTITEIPNGNKG